MIFIAFIVLAVLNMVIDAYAFTMIWNWYMPLLSEHIPLMTAGVAFGFSMLVSLYQKGSTYDTKDKDLNELAVKGINLVMGSVAYTMTMLFMAWLGYIFIT